MNVDSRSISAEERSYLRELAKKQREYASLPIMEERKRAWYEHNKGQGGRPVVHVDLPLAARLELFPPLRCTSPAAQEIEKELLFWICNHEMIDDDKVVPDFFLVPLRIWNKLCNIDIPLKRAEDSAGRKYGYNWEPVITDLERDFNKLQSSTWGVDYEGTEAHRVFVEEVLGDILPVVVKNKSLDWAGTLTGRVLKLMRMENMFCAMYDYPDKFHQMMAFLRDDLMAWIRWQQEEGLLTLNNDNDYVGSGSRGFTHELPTEECKQTGHVKTKDIWFNMNSQETVGISPDMYGEFIAPYYHDLAAEFGLIYYGCCEPVHDIWDPYLKDLPNLRKISISPWCDENIMGDALRDTSVIYCRKPSPNYITTGKKLDEEAYAEHIRKTVKAAKGCTLEISLRDLCTLAGRPEKLSKAVKIIRHELENF